MFIFVCFCIFSLICSLRLLNFQFCLKQTIDRRGPGGLCMVLGLGYVYMYMYVYVYVYVYMYVCLCLYVCVYVYVCI